MLGRKVAYCWCDRCVSLRVKRAAAESFRRKFKVQVIVVAAVLAFGFVLGYWSRASVDNPVGNPTDVGITGASGN